MAKAISQLTVATAIADADQLVITQSGTSKSITSILLRVIKFMSAGVLVGTRPSLNLIQGLNTSITVTDNSADNRIDVTIGSSAVPADDAAIKIYKYRSIGF